MSSLKKRASDAQDSFTWNDGDRYAFLSASPISLNWSAAQKTFTVSQDKAVAAVGKPLSAGSVAGVHRRQERRQTTPPK